MRDHKFLNTLSLIAQSQGYDMTLPGSKRALKQLGASHAIQHHLQALRQDIEKELQSMANPPPRSPQGKLQEKAPSRKRVPLTVISVNAPNAQVGRAFSHTLSLPDNILPGALRLYRHHTEEVYPDVTFEPETGLLSGEFKQPGEAKLTFYIINYLTDGHRQAITLHVNLTVIADPRTLWNDLPSDANARFHKPDVYQQTATFSDCALVGVSDRGRSHAHKGLHRDDDLRIMANDANGWVVFAAADGAGSAPYSRKGAELVCMHGTRALHESLSGVYGEQLETLYEQDPNNIARLNEAFQVTMVKAVHSAAKAIQAEVDQDDALSTKMFSTTLMLCAVKKVPDGCLILSFWVGDGAAVALHKDGRVTLLGSPDSGEYAGQTRFLDNRMFHDQSVYHRVHLTKVSDLSAVVLATDGITDPKFPSESALEDAERWHSLYGELKQVMGDKAPQDRANELLNWMKFFETGHHDDRSIVIYERL